MPVAGNEYVFGDGTASDTSLKRLNSAYYNMSNEHEFVICHLPRIVFFNASLLFWKYFIPEFLGLV